MSLHSHSSAPRQNKEGGERREHFGVFLIIVIIFIIIPPRLLWSPLLSSDIHSHCWELKCLFIISIP